MPELLQPLPYHFRLRNFLKMNHREIWDWFSSAEAESDYRDAVQLELLKSTYRLDRGDHEPLYVLVDEVIERLNLDVPVTLYQSQDDGGPGHAALYFTPGHGHVVFGGSILKLLDPDEQRALLGHELAHFKLWTEEGGEFLVADRILFTMAGDPRSEPSHHESARLYRLFTEIYADRGSLLVAESVETVVGTLIKTVTGMSSVNPTSYLAQAEEVVERSGAELKSGGSTHPEEYIRARALALWSDMETADLEADQGTPSSVDVEVGIEKLIVGRCALANLDLTQQERLADLTRELLRHLLEPDWVRTGRTLAHAKLFFSDFKPDEPRLFESMEALATEIGSADDKAKHYLVHLLLDFVAADRELEENGLALGMRAADVLDLSAEFEAAARKELKVLKRDISAIRNDLDGRLSRAAEEHQSLSKAERQNVVE